MRIQQNVEVPENTPLTHAGSGIMLFMVSVPGEAEEFIGIYPTLSRAVAYITDWLAELEIDLLEPTAGEENQWSIYVVGQTAGPAYYIRGIEYRV